MKRSYVSYIVLAILCLGLVFFLKWKNEHKFVTNKNAPIVENTGDTINALLFYHASDYFVYRGSPIGFQYDMLKLMAKDFNKKIFITIETDPENAFYTCFTNEYDLVAMDVNKGKPFTSYLNFSEPHSYSYPVLIARKNTKICDTSVNKIYIPAQFPVDISLLDISPNTKWEYIYSEHNSTEDLFEQLDEKQIDFIASDYSLAVSLLPFYPQLKVIGRIGSDFNREWVLNPCNPTLNDSINEWIVQFKRTKRYENLCKRYLTTTSHVIQQSFGKHSKSSISSYDAIIKKYSKIYGLDWRFVSAIIFQETRFNTGLIGVGGSFGIMQMMPETAEHYGISDTSSVDDQIRVGVKHIASLYKRYPNIKNEEDHLYVTAAAYNAGSGHLQDAIALSVKYAQDSVYSWQQIFKYLSLKSQKKYYNDPVVRCGYYPGNHSIKYAKEVMVNYHAYQCVYH